MNLKTLSAIALTAISAAAFATETPAPEFKTVDLNADGFISQEEAKTIEGLEATFIIADINKDGQLDEAEYIEITQG